MASRRRHREAWRAYRRRYYAEHAEQERARDRARAPRRRARRLVRDKERRRTDVRFRLGLCLRSRLADAVRKGHKGSSAILALGCGLDEFVRYIATRFTEGMSWENYGKWQLDHIRPLASFDLTDPAECAVACHYSNLQPLWATDNARKGARITA